MLPIILCISLEEKSAVIHLTCSSMCFFIVSVFSSMLGTWMFSMELKYELLGRLENSIAPISFKAWETNVEFWLGSPSFRKRFFRGLAFCSWKSYQHHICKFCPFILRRYWVDKITHVIYDIPTIEWSYKLH